MGSGAAGKERYMVTEATGFFLTHVYFLSHRLSGWLHRMVDIFNLDAEEERYLENLDDTMMDGNVAHACWLDGIQQEVVSGVFFADSAEEAVALLSERIAEAYADYRKHADADKSAADRLVMLSMRDVEWMERLRGRLVAKLNPQLDKAWRITDQDVEKARAYPLEQLLGEQVVRGYVACPFHQDTKRHMLVKNVYGWCFSCGEWTDAIKWVQHVNQVYFLTAVRQLCGA